MDNKLINKARSLRQRATKPEQILWLRIRNRQIDNAKFRRQFPIPPFIADFACVDKKLIIEIDGETHVSQTNYDQDRTSILNQHGYTVLRFTNNEIMRNIEGVLIIIREHL